MSSIHFLNGALVSEEELLISPRDLGYSRGFGVFDFLRTYSGHKPFLLRRHVERLFRSAERINLAIPWSTEQIEAWVLDTLRANETEVEKVVRIMISGGESKTFLQSVTPTIVIIVDPVLPFAPDKYEKGVGVTLAEFQRYEPSAKTTNYIEAVRHMRAAVAMGSEDLVYHASGMVLEGASSNVFAVIDGQLLTPTTGVLGGITRDVLLETLRLDMPVLAEDFTLDALRGAQEVFLTASGREVMPVTRINMVPVGNGEVGPITQQVMKQHHEYVNSTAWQ